MELFAGKTTTERNKIIAAIVLGALALIALFWAFGPSFTRAKADPAKPSPTPTPANKAATANKSDFVFPSDIEINKTWASTEVDFNGTTPGGADSGRNIFAFYEPPP